MKVLNKINWEGHTIEFIPVLSHKYLWIATANELRIDGSKVATSGGLCFSCKAQATIQHSGRPVTIEMRSSSRWQSFVNLNCELLIDGQSIGRGVSRIRFQL
jgi:hypothetical protein